MKNNVMKSRIKERREKLLRKSIQEETLTSLLFSLLLILLRFNRLLEKWIRFLEDFFVKIIINTRPINYANLVENRLRELMEKCLLQM